MNIDTISGFGHVLFLNTCIMSSTKCQVHLYILKKIQFSTFVLDGTFNLEKYKGKVWYMLESIARELPALDLSLALIT